MSDEERKKIIKQHSTVYDGYSTGNVTSNMTPLMVYDAAGDKEGVTVNNLGHVKPYTNHHINEITAKPLNYDSIDDAYSFVSKGPSDVFEYELYNDVEFNGLLDDDEKLNADEDKIEEDINESLNMFRRFKKFN